MATVERRSRQRFEFLTRLSDALAASSTLAELMRNAPRAAVPDLGDWCAIYVLPEPTSKVPTVEVAHVDPARVDRAKQLQRQFGFNSTAPVGAAKVMRTGAVECYNHIPPEAFALIARNDDELEAMTELNPKSIVVVPLVSPQRIVGAMLFANTTTDRPYDQDDVVTAEAAAGRIATAIENIWLVGMQRNIATTLQRSLLPEQLPAIPGVEVAVRYWAAGEGTEVGGDFYDVFAIDDGSWGVVIGDVCGTGPNAAALTGLARHTIRAAAVHGHDPETILEWLNDAMRRGTSDLFSTASVARLGANGGRLTIEVANGGHPLPVLVTDGHARPLGRPGSLLGVFDELTVEAVEQPLRSGDLVVMYTDGVTDVAPPHGLTHAQVHDLAAQAAKLDDAEQAASFLGDAIASILPMSERQDDIALLVLRVA